ncbi:MAG: metalloregulator ArsR/SmtB family transcription factor [Myxococcales bacterium]|nr:metalloregulator ArsR/SmtB family transcription factor [Myxococcales bacterium]
MPRTSSSTDTFRALAAPPRRQILDLLCGGDRPVAELAAPLGLSMSATSQHLKILREADLVRVRRQGRQRVYQLHAEPLRAVAEWTARYHVFWGERLGALRSLLSELDGGSA